MLIPKIGMIFRIIIPKVSMNFGIRTEIGRNSQKIADCRVGGSLLFFNSGLRESCCGERAVSSVDGIECGGEVTLAGVGEQSHYGLALVFRFLRQLYCRMGSRTR